MRWSLWVVFILAVAANAQPVEGPWVLLESDSTPVYDDVEIVVAGGITAKVFAMTDTTAPQKLVLSNFALDSHELLDSTLILDGTDGPTQLWSAAIDNAGQWALATKTDSAVMYTSFSYRLRLIAGADDAWSTGQVYHGEGYWWEGDPLYAWGVDVKVQPAVGGGWIVSWGAGETSSFMHVLEFWITPSIAFISPDDTVIIRDQYSWMEIETLCVLGQSIAPDTAALFSYYYGGWFNPSGIRIATMSRQDQYVVQEEMVECALCPVTMAMLGDTSFIGIADDSGWNAARIVIIDRSGNCAVAGIAELPNQPNAVAWNQSYGFACVFVDPSSIQLARINTSGMMQLGVGTVYWRDSLRTIRDADVAIAGNGEVAVTWTEAPVSGSGASSRVMLASVGWNTPLASDRRPEAAASVKEYALAAYPNPFNNSVRISYDLPRAGEVRLEVFDVLGRNVETLVNQTMAAGSHNISWSTDGPSGIYFVQLHAGNETRVEKLMFIR